MSQRSPSPLVFLSRMAGILLAACGTVGHAAKPDAISPVGADTQAYTTLPVEAFARLPDVSQMTLSPRGVRIASIARVNSGEKQGTVIRIVDLHTGKSTVPVFTDNLKYKFQWITWANDKQLLASLIYPATRFGESVEETRLIRIDAENSAYESVLPPRFLQRLDLVPQFQDSVIDMLSDDEHHILLSLTVGVRTSEVFRVSLKNGKAKTLERKGYLIDDWLTDRQHNVRAAVRREEAKYEILVRRPGERDWEIFWEFDAFSESQVWPIAFGADPKILYVRKYHNDKLAIFKLDVTDPERELTLVYADESYDVSGRLIYSDFAKKIIGTSHSQQSGFTFWEPDYVALQDGINRALPDSDNIIVSFSADERKYLLLATSDTDSGTYFLGDRDKGTIDLVGYRYHHLDPANMAPKRSINYEARDGVSISAFLTLPKGSDGKNLPIVIFPHGGPISYTGGGFDYWTQFLANRGYAILQMDFRGSSGYGYDFMKAGIQNWGKQMQTDVEDGTRWAIESGIADPNRICLLGASYGGYAALMESASAPDLYQCAVSFAGVTDVELLVRNYRKFTNYELVKQQVGDNYFELKDISPVKYAEQVTVPILLAHGTKDRTVDYIHSNRMYSALKRAGKKVTYIELEGGDHYLSIEEHRVHFFVELEKFLAAHLGS